ncbi:MAG TPA: PspC domain-containing protein [Bacteroidales bacterium]|nr:PspC domain-containing protein [Bacteroidales bacterium]HOK98984.1 PspC domain-containing protein [Bacteroidales bacterium]HPO65817.1 PspC domain-containing protein [Bacteroidales bacterium]
MKKSVNINLGGIVFHIDEDAYERLHEYLAGLERKFGNTAESKEIINDIESRMAELLQERLSSKKQSVDIADVEYVIAIMGGPEEVAQEAEYSTINQGNTTKRWYQRKLYRDPDNAVIGGVCGGLGAFFGIDPVILRILFLVLLFFGGSSVLLYLILWIALPAARTPVQKLEMRGEDINVSNIEKASRMSTQDSPRNGWQTFFDTVGKVLTGIFKAVAKIIAVFGGLFLIVVGTVLVFFFLILNTSIFDGFHPSDFSFSLPMLFHFGVIQGHWCFQLANFLVFVLPILAIIYLGLKLLLGWKFNDRIVWKSTLLLWLLGLVLWVVLAISSLKSIRSEHIVEEKLLFKSLPDRMLVLDVPEPWSQPTHTRHQLKTNDRTMYYVNNKNEIIGKTELVIERNVGNEVEVLIEKTARGRDEYEAEKWAQNLVIQVSQNDSILYLPAYFTLHHRKEWHAQQLKVIVKVPTGQTIYISSNLKDILVDADLNENRWISELPGKTWTMTSNGLQQVNRPE